MRRFSHLVRLTAIVLAASFALCACAPQWSTSETFVMNTVLSQTVEGSGQICSGNEQIARDLENLLSRTLEGTEIYEANHTEDAVSVSPDTFELLQISIDAWEATEGAFDPALGAFRDAWGFGTDSPAVPSEETLADLLAAPGADAIQIAEGAVSSGGADIDLGAAAKGYALDEMRKYMQSQNVSNALISFGGAILALGCRSDGREWSIGIRDPLSDDSSAYIGTFFLTDAAVETSGISEQYFTENGTVYHHILDPQTGMPADNGLASVSVVSDEGVMADIWSTALFVMGPDAGLAFADANGIAALFITTERRIIRSSSFTYEIHDLDSSYEIV